MMEAPPDAPLSVRLGAKIGPEVVASILVVAVVIVGLVVALSGRQSPAAVSSPAPSSAAVSSAAASVAVIPSGTPVASSPSPSGSPSAPPVRSVAAGPVLVIVDRLLGQRSELQAELAKSGTDAPAIAELLRDVNASIVAMVEPLIDLAADSSMVDLATRIRAINAATFEAVRRAQRASIRNEAAYRQGATEVVAALEPLPGIRAELAALTGDTTSPDASASQAAGTADPSGATP